MTVLDVSISFEKLTHYKGITYGVDKGGAHYKPKFMGCVNA